MQSVNWCRGGPSRKWGRLLLLSAVALMGALTQPAEALALPAANSVGAGDRCEIHVWVAGRPNSKALAKLMRRVDPAELDLSNPLSTSSLFGPLSRAKALSEADLGKLLPNAGAVTIVRHDELVDLDKAPLGKLTGRLAPSSAPCYADLIIGKLYALFPNPGAAWERAGVVGAALAGSDRLVIEFWLRDFSASADQPRVYKKKNDSPLPHVPPNSEEMRTSVEASASANLSSFAAYVDQQRRR